MDQTGKVAGEFKIKALFCIKTGLLFSPGFTVPTHTYPLALIQSTTFHIYFEFLLKKDPIFVSSTHLK